jgi:putative NADH-flavin reductase
MRFLALGATGRTGVLFVKKALDQGRQISTLVRRDGFLARTLFVGQ